jgi:hypothetical protein
VIEDAPEAVAVADLNGDLRADMVLATAEDGITVFLNSATGFSVIGPFLCGITPISLAVGDLDGDQIPDVAAANNGDDTVSVLYGKGNGTFESAAHYGVGVAPVRIRAADLNGDLFTDLVVVNNLGGSISVLRGQPGRTFAVLPAHPVPATPRALAVGHFDDSGHVGIAVGHYPQGQLNFLAGNGDGTFGPASGIVLAGGISDLYATDLNTDGLDELLAITGGNAFRVCSERDGAYQVVEAHATGTAPICLTVADFDQDALGDVAISAYTGGTVTVLLRSDEGEGEGQHDRHTGDQNGDSLIDLSELLRVIQFFNMSGYRCATNLLDTEDGYLPGPGANHACTPHDSDYNPQDWSVSLSELLRLIQFFNIGGYHACPGEGTEDGFCTRLS